MYSLNFKSLDKNKLDKIIQRLTEDCHYNALDDFNCWCPIGSILPCPFDNVISCKYITVEDWKNIFREVNV